MKMFCVTTDNVSSSNEAFIDYLLVLMSMNEESSFLIEFWIKCLANIINTALQDSLVPMKLCFDKVI